MWSKRPGAEVQELRQRVVGSLNTATRASHIAFGAAVLYFAAVLNYGQGAYEDRDRVAVAAVALVVGGAAGVAMGPARGVARRPGEGALLLLAVFTATYLCVPETDQYRVALVVPVALLIIEVVARRQLPIEFYGVVGAVIAWASMLGAVERTTAYVGALFAWWAVMLLALVDAVVPIRHWLATWLVGAVAAVSVVAVARTGGISDDLSYALVTVVVAIPVSLLAGVGLAWGVAQMERT